jgi:hypothetical protein
MASRRLGSSSKLSTDEPATDEFVRNAIQASLFAIPVSPGRHRLVLNAHRQFNLHVRKLLSKIKGACALVDTQGAG